MLKAMVLPEPVGARPQTSRPASASAIVAAWIGNGSRMPRSVSRVTTSLRTPRSVKLGTGKQLSVWRRNGQHRVSYTGIDLQAQHSQLAAQEVTRVQDLWRISGITPFPYSATDADS